MKESKPQPFEKGKCFICNNPCPLESYCHYECALVYYEEKQDMKLKLKNGNKSINI